MPFIGRSLLPLFDFDGMAMRVTPHSGAGTGTVDLVAPSN